MIAGRDLKQRQEHCEAGSERDERRRVDRSPSARLRIVDSDPRGHDRRNNDPDRNVDEEQPVPRELLRDVTTEERTQRRRQHRHRARDQDRARLQLLREHLVARGKSRGNDDPAAKALHGAPRDERDEALRKGATEARDHETGDAEREDAHRRERTRQPAAERDRNHLCDQVGRLNPTEPIERDAQGLRNPRQRGGDNLDVEDRHEHADAHRREAEPVASGRRHRTGFTTRANAASSQRIRQVSIARFSTPKAAACHTRPTASEAHGSSHATTR